jgi:hypothetical protein
VRHSKRTMSDRIRQSSRATQEDLPELMDEKQVSERFAIPLNTLRYWRTCGDGPDFYKLGTARRSPVRYDVAVLAAWLRAHLRVQRARATAEEKHVAL